MHLKHLIRISPRKLAPKECLNLARGDPVWEVAKFILRYYRILSN